MLRGVRISPEVGVGLYMKIRENEGDELWRKEEKDQVKSR